MKLSAQTLWLLLAVPAADLPAGNVEVVTFDSGRAVAKVAEWNLSDALHLANGRNVKSVELDCVSFPSTPDIPKPDKPPAWQIDLTRLGHLSCEIVGGEADSIECRHSSLGLLKIPVEEIERLTRLDDCADPPERNADAEEDQVTLVNGDVVRGAVAQVNGNELRLDESNRQRTIPWSRINAVQFAAQAPESRDAFSADLVLRDGTRLRAASFEWRGDTLQAELPRLGKVHVPESALQRIDVIGGRRIRLCELHPTAYEHRPLLGPTWPMGVDTNAAGGPLRANGVVAAHGLGLHSGAHAAWKLDRRFTRFVARAAIDDSAGPWADAVLVVRIDGREALRTAPLHFKQPATSIDLDLIGATTLDVTVDFGSNADVQDRVDLLDAALLRNMP